MSTIPCVKSVLQKTFIAGCQFNNGRSYRIFYQTPDGSIHAFTTDNYGAKWDGGNAYVMVPPGRAKMETPMATVMFTWNKQACSRTFYVGKNNEVRVFGVTGGRLHDGRINGGNFIASGHSRIGAVAWVEGNTPYIRMYFQAPDDHIQEICFDGNSSEQYNTGHSFPTPLQGTALAFLCQPRSARDPGSKGIIIRGFYQHTDLRIMEIVWDGKWHPGNFINGDTPVEKQTHITASISSGKPIGQICVYWTNSCGGFHSVTECICRDGEWQGPKLISVCCSSSSSRLLCCAHIPDNSTQTCVRLFFMGCNGLINDTRRENGHWGWGGKSGGQCQWLPF
ncbi:hypothetical protein ONS96_008388 [Cadophora gregata f. sp. sojae]|nr:hypothetical protein ONS96_008388 [Cadophora gregata f. sp. sojae]